MIRSFPMLPLRDPMGGIPNLHFVFCMQKSMTAIALSEEKFFSKRIDDEKKQRQHKQTEGRCEEPAELARSGRDHRWKGGSGHEATGMAARRMITTLSGEPVFDVSETRR